MMARRAIFIFLSCAAAVWPQSSAAHGRRLLLPGAGGLPGGGLPGGGLPGGGVLPAGLPAGGAAALNRLPELPGAAGNAAPSANAAPAANGVLQAPPGALAAPAGTGGQLPASLLGPAVAKDIKIGTVASVVRGVRDKRDRAYNGGVCDIATRGFTCDQAVVSAANPKWCQDMTTNRCGAIEGTLIYNVTRASAGLNATAGAFSGTPYGPIAPGLAAVQSQLASAYSAAVSNAGTVPLGVIESALSRPGVEFGTQSECGLRVVVRADLAPSATKYCLYCACGVTTDASIPYIQWRLASAGCAANSSDAAAAQSPMTG